MGGGGRDGVAEWVQSRHIYGLSSMVKEIKKETTVGISLELLLMGRNPHDHLPSFSIHTTVK